MTDAKHREQEAAGEVWERSDATGLISERDAIVAYIKSVELNCTEPNSLERSIVHMIGYFIERGDHLKEAQP